MTLIWPPFANFGSPWMNNVTDSFDALLVLR